MRTPHHPARDDLSLEAVLYALSDPTRLCIVRTIAAGGEHSCGSLGLPLPKPTLSHHFKVLREAGMIEIRLEGTQRLNSLRRADLEARFPGLLAAVLRALPSSTPVRRSDAQTAGPPA